MQIDQTFDGREISVKRGSSFDLLLYENPTTGFRWQINSSGAPVLTLLNSSFDAQTTPGRGGTRHWTFRADQTGVAPLKLEYRRSFDTETPASRTFHVTVLVTE